MKNALWCEGCDAREELDFPMEIGKAGRTMKAFAAEHEKHGGRQLFVWDSEKLKPKEVIRKVSDREKKVLQVLADAFPNDEANCLYTRHVAKETGLTIPEARRSLKALVRKGLAQYVRGLFDEDGMVAGSGYCATMDGALLLNACTDCKTRLSDMVTRQCQACWEKNPKPEQETML